MKYLVAVDRHEPDEYGGSFHVAWQLAKLAQSCGHQVSMLCGSTDGRARATEMIEGVRVARYGVRAYASMNPARLSGHIRAAARHARRELADTSYDVVHLHSVASGLAALEACGAGARVLRTVYSPLVAEQLARWNGAGLEDRVKRTYAKIALARLERRLLVAADRVHVLSAFMQEWLASTYHHQISSKVVRIPWWCETRRSLTRESAKASLGIAPDETVLFTVRRLVPRMGIDVLIDAAARVKSQRKFRVLIAGDGPDRAALTGRIGALSADRRVTMLGAVTNAELDRLYQAADMFVLPSKELECFGLATLAALGYGCPVIGTRDGATPEVVGELHRDFLVPPGCPDALAAALDAFLEGRLRVPSESEIAAYVTARYSAPRIQDAFSRLLDETAALGGRSRERVARERLA